MLVTNWGIFQIWYKFDFAKQVKLGFHQEYLRKEQAQIIHQHPDHRQDSLDFGQNLLIMTMSKSWGSDQASRVSEVPCSPPRSWHMVRSDAMCFKRPREEDPVTSWRNKHYVCTVFWWSSNEMHIVKQITRHCVPYFESSGSPYILRSLIFF